MSGFHVWVEETDRGNYLRLKNGEGEKVFSDRKNPKDMTFTRELAWVAKELQKAYDQGLEEGALGVKPKQTQRILVPSSIITSYGPIS